MSDGAIVERRDGDNDRRAVRRGGRRHTDLPTSKQRAILTIIEHYSAATGEACPATHVARRLNVHHSTIQEHYKALFRKGWLRAPDGPATLID